jgi:hypothetical protein
MDGRGPKAVGGVGKVEAEAEEEVEVEVEVEVETEVIAEFFLEN